MAFPYTPPKSTILNDVVWGQTWYWDVKFEGAPYPFNTWFPAYEVDRKIASVSSYDIQAGMTNYKIPQAFEPKDISLSCYDDENCTLERWFVDWIENGIFGELKTVRTLTEVCKILIVAQLSSTKKIVMEHQYYVYPEGSIRSLRNSQSDIAMISLSFHVAGYKLLRSSPLKSPHSSNIPDVVNLGQNLVNLVTGR